MDRATARFPFLLILILLNAGCQNAGQDPDPRLPERQISSEFKEYWYAGEAEITSYQLEQSRYGEQRQGTAVLIFVKEDLLPGEQVKADEPGSGDIPVLKLNATKNFTTGIYPYSIMQSVFYPLEGKTHALKVTASIQEWCGQVYMQLNNRDNYEVVSHSYFEREGDQVLFLDKTHLENEVWTQLRIDPELLPVGNIKMIPSLEFIRLAHIDIKAYDATAEFFQDGENSIYKVTYPSLNRNLRIYYQNKFPFKVEKWEEVVMVNGKEYLTKASKMEEIKIDYWNKNSNKDLHLREHLNIN